MAYLQKGDYDHAIEDLDTAIQLKPNYANAYTNRGVAHYKKGKIADAIKDYTQAIELNSHLAVPYGNRGEAWLHLKKWDKAREDLTTAKDMGEDIIAAFRDDHGSIKNFERKYKVKLPDDIADMLTP